MNHAQRLREPERTLPLSGETEVLVVGGGIAGIAAALAAARGGARVMLLEREYALGGMATLGLITIYLPLCDGNGEQVIYGIGEELLRLSIKHGAEAEYPAAWLDGHSLQERRERRFRTRFNPHLFALECERLLLDAGVELRYGALACGVLGTDDRIEAVVVEDKSGRGAIRADRVIDCSGDADVCRMAGERTADNPEKNGLASWYYYFSQGGVDLKMFGLADVVPEERGAADGPTDSVERIDEHFRFSGTDGPELSAAVTAAHQKMLAHILEQRNRDLSFAPVAISSIPLVRMSRRLCGRSTLCEADVFRYREDSVGMTGDWCRRGPTYEIPFGALFGGTVKNLLAAGRIISVSQALWNVTRVIPACAVTGEAAGTAAALCGDFSRMDIGQLQARLMAQRVKLHTGQRMS